MLETELCGIRLKNPTIVASGILGSYKASLIDIAKHGAGAATIKSISREPREGHNNPIIITYDSSMLNAVGYPSPGIEQAKQEFSDLDEVGIPVIASIVGKTASDIAFLASQLSGFAAIEVSLSCPHTPGFGLLAGQGTPESTYEITKAVKKSTKLPVFIKLSPNIPNIAEVAHAAEKAGANGITAVNTLGPGMVINLETKKPVLDFKVGGMSGPAIKPIAVRCVYDIYKAVKIPIIGTGGITYGKDAIEMIMAGASAIGIGSAVYYRGKDVFTKTCNEMQEWMKQNNYSSIKEISGIAHE